MENIKKQFGNLLYAARIFVLVAVVVYAGVIFLSYLIG